MASELDKARDDAEKALAAILRKLNKEHRARVLAAVRQYGSVEAIPQNFWDAIKAEKEREAAAVFVLLLATGYQDMQRRIERTAPKDTSVGSSADLETIRQRTARTAAALGREAVGAHVDSIRRRVSNLPTDASETELRKGIGNIMTAKVPKDGERDGAESTAITSSTRGVSAAEESARRDEGTRRGIQIDVKWRTEQDGKVCPICRPLDGKKSDRWEEITARTQTAQVVAAVKDGPPAHPNCRCNLEPVYRPAPSRN